MVGRIHILGALALGAALVPSAHAAPRLEKPREVKFETADGVELQGTFYRGPRDRDAACVLLLHDVGRHRGEDGWVDLARALQRQGQSVLAFDFRGHGKSTSVDERFWSVPWNWQRVRGYRPARPPKTISHKDFLPTYLPMLANDVAAARAFLDVQNDAGECNSANVVVVGAGEGATVGALWLASEGHRHRVTGRLAVRLATRPEVDRVRGALWLDLSGSLGRRRVPVLDWVRTAGKDHDVPHGLLYTTGDRASADLARRCLAAVKTRKDDKDLTDARGVDGPPEKRADLAGRFVAQVLKERAAKWERRDHEEETFLWSAPRRPQVIAKAEGSPVPALLPLDWFGVR